MKTFAGRRIRNSAILATVGVAIVLTYLILRTTLLRTEFITGWFLAALIAMLAAYNLFKKLSVLPLGSSADWLQRHIYAGLLTLLVFGLRTLIHGLLYDPLREARPRIARPTDLRALAGRQASQGVFTDG